MSNLINSERTSKIAQASNAQMVRYLYGLIKTIETEGMPNEATLIEALKRIIKRGLEAGENIE